MTEEQKEYLINNLAIRTPLNELKKNYEEFFSTIDKRVYISGDEIMKFQKENNEEIKKVAAKELNNLQGTALGLARVRLEGCQAMFMKACETKPRRSFPVTDETTGLTRYEVLEDADHVNARGWMDLIQKEQFFYYKALMELIGRGVNPKDHPELDPAEGITIPRIFSGFGDSDEDLLLEAKEENA